MAAPSTYFVDHVSGSDSMAVNGLTGATAWKTVNFALQQITHDASNGTQILIKSHSSLSSGQGEPQAIDPDTISSGYANIGAGAPLIFRGYESQDVFTLFITYGEATLYGEYDSGFSTTEHLIVSDFDDVSGEVAKETNHVIFYDLHFKSSGSSHPHISLNSSIQFVNCRFSGGTHGDCIKLTDDCSFISCHFSDMSSTASSGNHLIDCSGPGHTVLYCVFDFLSDDDNKPYTCIKTGGTRTNWIFGNVFMLGDGCSAVKWSGGASVPGCMWFVGNSLYSESDPAVDSFRASTNAAKRIVYLDNLVEGFAVGLDLKSSHNVLAWGGNSAYNNTTNFDTVGDVWYEFRDGNFGSADANNNKDLSQSPYLDATNKKMSCRPARTSAGDEAVVGQGLSLSSHASAVVKRGDRGAVPRGPLTPPVDGGIVR